METLPFEIKLLIFRTDDIKRLLQYSMINMDIKKFYVILYGD